MKLLAFDVEILRHDVGAFRLGLGTHLLAVEVGKYGCLAVVYILVD